MRTILWRRLDIPGHEYARLERHDSSWTLSGIALLQQEGQPCKLEYAIDCDLSWSTTAAHVSGWVGNREIDVSIAAARDHSWSLNGESVADVRGCIDIDLNFSPSTNLLPIRRLNLDVGQRAEVHAAWLRFPGFTLERLVQSYTRLAEHKYRYESAGGKFVADIEVNELGFPISYGTIWIAE